MYALILIALVLGFLAYYFLGKPGKPKRGANDVVVAKSGDMRNGEMKVVKVHEQSVLLIKDNDSFNAIGNSCSHAAAALSSGSYHDGVVRCPLHGACFNVKTGDIEDFPGCLNIPVFKCRVDGEEVVVSATPEEVAVKKVQPKLVKKGADPRTFVIVGAGAAGVSAAFQLRQEGFEGRVVMVGGEKHLPYDRTKLSKAMTSQADKIGLRPLSDFQDYDVELMLGVQVTKLNSDTKTIFLSSGETINYSACLVATGANPLRLEKWIKGNEVPRPNVYVLRNAEEGNAIYEACKGKRVAIVGSSFIGVETAAAVVGIASSVVVIGMEQVPFERVLGLEVGGMLQKLHESKGIKFQLNAVCEEFKIADNLVHTIVLKGGIEVPCDIVVIGAGVSPATGFIDGRAVKKHQDQSIIADQYLATGAPGLYVAGDLVRFPLACLDGELARIEHWGMAMTMGKVAAKNMVHPENQVPIKSVPVFWTAAHGKSCRYAGHGLGVTDIIVDYLNTPLDPTNPKFAAYYARNGKVIAVSSMNADPMVADYAQLLRAGVTITFEDIVGPAKTGNSVNFIHETLLGLSGGKDKKTK